MNVSRTYDMRTDVASKFHATENSARREPSATLQGGHMGVFRHTHTRIASLGNRNSLIANRLPKCDPASASTVRSEVQAIESYLH